MTDRIDFGRHPTEAEMRASGFTDDQVRWILDEHEASERVRPALRELLEATAPYTWHWGDGFGGWFLEQLIGAAEDLGLSLPRHDYSFPPVGAHRVAVYERDAYRCQHCGSWQDLTIDHIVPRARGGTDDFDNLQVLCRSCNSRKGVR